MKKCRFDVFEAQFFDPGVGTVRYNPCFATGTNYHYSQQIQLMIILYLCTSDTQRRYSYMTCPCGVHFHGGKYLKIVSYGSNNEII